jgi:hypothetical protein
MGNPPVRNTPLGPRRHERSVQHLPLPNRHSRRLTDDIPSFPTEVKLNLVNNR